MIRSLAAAAAAAAAAAVASASAAARLLALWLLATPLLAGAASYSFPGNLPTGCTGSAGNYSCGALSLGYGDTISIAGTKPATITVNGALSTDNAKINAAGAASDLKLVVTGALTPGYQAQLKAHITAGSVNAGSTTQVSFGGNITVGSGSLSIGESSTVAGTLSSSSGAISIGQTTVVSGDVSSSSGAVSVGYQSEVKGALSSNAAITLAQGAIVRGAISGGSGNVSIGYAARADGSISTGAGSISLAQASVAAACVRSTGSASITLGYQAQVHSVCCGNSCGNSCVSNNSTYAMPAACSAAPPSSSLHHLQIEHASGSGLTCTPSSLTVRACQNSDCSLAYTGGVSGTLAASGSGMVVNWPAGAAFSIGAGSSSTTLAMQQTTVGSVLLSASGLAPAASSATSCNFGSPACTHSAADAGLLLDVPHLRAESSWPFTVSAVRKSDNSTACVPAFAGVSKSVTFKCIYSNPGSGGLPVRIGNAALNSGNNSAAACDASGRAVSLDFNASGVASSTLIYADVGQLLLSASYAGSGNDAGLVLSGSDSFIVAPYDFAVAGISSSAIAAGAAFSATVTARNFAGNATPNFGRETVPEGASLGFVRTHPNGSGAVTGGFSGSLGSFGSGVATASNLAYSEVGRGNVSAQLASGSYLGSGQHLAGSSEGALVWCANEGGSCVLPSGATASVYYQAGGTGRVKVLAGLSGTVACNSATFGDPSPGVGKLCSYVATSGQRGVASAAALFKPHHFDLSASAACGSFSYAGQPFAASLIARNAGGTTTVNYDGSSNTSPNFAKASTLSEVLALGLGSLSGGSVAAAAFSAGVASANPGYAFSSKTTAPQTLQLRATDADAVSSQGYAEASMPLRSGRLRLSNAFGSARAALQLAVVAELWSGNSWVLNSADSCTSLAAANVALSNPRTAAGTASSASSSAGAVVLANGSGLLTLAAPSPAGSSLSLDVAINLGSGGSDQSCHANHPASTGAAKPWLRSQNGSCASTADRDPAARASFGLFSPETRRTVHVRDLF